MDYGTLIHEIQRRPALWDLHSRQHCNRDIVYKHWTEVSELLGVEVQYLKRRWKSLRDNFRCELKKVPAGKEDDSRLPADQYLSRWPYFKMLFFLRDTMLWKKRTGGRLTSGDLQDARKESSPPSPYSQISELNSSHIECQSQEPQNGNEVMEPESTPTFQVANHKQPSRKRNRDWVIDNNSYMQLERAKLEVEKQKGQLLLLENRKRQRDDNDADRHFLLSMLPFMSKVPEHKKLMIQIRIQEMLSEVIFQDTEDCVELRSIPSQVDITTKFYRP